MASRRCGAIALARANVVSEAIAIASVLRGFGQFVSRHGARDVMMPRQDSISARACSPRLARELGRDFV